MENKVYLYWLVPIAFSYMTLAGTFLGFDRAGYLILLIEILTCLYLYNSDELFRAVVSYKVNVLFLLIVIYYAISSALHDVPVVDNFTAYFREQFKCYFLLVMCCYLFLKNPSKTVCFTIAGYLIFLFLSVRGGQIEISEYDEGERLNGLGAHSTQLGQMAGFALILIVYMRYFMKISWGYMFFFSMIPIYAILIAGSRNGLLGLLMSIGILILTPYVCKFKLNVKNIVFSVAIILVSYVAVNYLLDNTYVGERLLNTEEQAQMQDESYRTGTWLDLLGDRGLYYYLGYHNFIDHPFLGIGYHNFRYYNHIPWPAHSEYVVHVAEGGILGGYLFFSFIGIIFKKLFSIYRKQKTTTSFVLFVGFCVFLMMCVTTFTYNQIQFYPFIGICVASFIANDLKISIE